MMMKSRRISSSHSGRLFIHRAITTTASPASSDWIAGPISAERAGLMMMESGFRTAYDRDRAIRPGWMLLVPAMSLTGGV